MIRQLKEFDSHFYDVVTVGERGQVVVPSKARKELKINPGDKLVAIKGAHGKVLVLVNMKEAAKTFDKMSKMFSAFAAKYAKEG
jgi:AbrB family looped-hinge helix DNA binding protein